MNFQEAKTKCNGLGMSLSLREGNKLILLLAGGRHVKVFDNMMDLHVFLLACEQFTHHFVGTDVEALRAKRDEMMRVERGLSNEDSYVVGEAIRLMSIAIIFLEVFDATGSCP